MRAELFDAFAPALTRADLTVPPGLTTWNGSDVGHRFAIYRNNVVVSLVDALAAGFPVTQALVGEEFFRAMARVFCTEHPPRSVIMARYGDDFPQFIRTFAPAASVPYLADVAALEAARIIAYHAADADPVPREAFAVVAPDKLADLTMTLHPSLHLLRSPYAIVSLWGAHNGHGELSEVDAGVAEDALVLRPRDEVLVLRLAAGVADLLTGLAQGLALADVIDSVARAVPDLDVASAFHLLMTSGAVTSMSIAGEPS